MPGIVYTMIIILLLIVWPVWLLYSGDLYPREAGIIALVALVACALVWLLKITPIAYFVVAIGVMIVLIVKTYGGDVTIR